MIPTLVISHNAPEILFVDLRHLDLDIGLLLLKKEFAEIVALGRRRCVHSSA